MEIFYLNYCYFCIYIAKSVFMRKITRSIVFIIILAFAAGCSPEEEPQKGGGDIVVDLGLPSGTLWATWNVGANAPEEYGDFFAWGESQSKKVYNWNTYKYYKISNDGLTKYYNKVEYGYGGPIDNLTVLEADDDVASVKWGAIWHTPTKAEWEELFQNTTGVWVIRNGVRGLLFTALNGKTLFLPAAGYRWNDKLCHNGSSIHYWSSSLYTDLPYYAWSFRVDEENSLMYGSSRSYGKSVRAVLSIH